MQLDAKQQVLLALYIEYQKDLPNMRNVTCTSLNMDIDVFHAALRKLSTEKYIEGVSFFSADSDEFYSVRTDNVYLTHAGIEYIENNLGIAKELTNADKVLYIIRKCGVWGLRALKIFAVGAIEHIHDVF